MAYTTIDNPSEHFSIKTYSGNNTAETKSTDFQADLLWIKCRNNARSHLLYDSTRGFGNDKHLVPNTDVAEDGDVDGGQVDQGERGFIGSNSSSGFYTNSGTAGMHLVNATNNTYVAWYWKANGGTTTTNSAGANGADHESVYQADDTAGFSIVTYTSDNQSGDTIIKHGLSTAPTFMIHKARNAGSTIWWTYHKELTNDGYMHLESNNANQDGSTNVWRNTAPTSSVFKVGLDSIAAANGRTMVAYCFAPVQGYSKFGKYVGNGNADGPFVYLGFKPAWVMIKNTDNSFGSDNSWIITDSTRNPTNKVDNFLYANTNRAEGDADFVDMDFLSNGFKLRANEYANNYSGDTFIYMAFAESPFVSSKGVPTTAR